MFCTKCGAMIPEGQSVCSICGNSSAEQGPNLKKKQPNKILVAVVTLLTGWLGIHNFIWGKKICGVFQFILFVAIVLVTHENFVLEVVFWALFVAQMTWVLYDSFMIYQGKFVRGDGNSLGAALIACYAFFMFVGFCGLWDSVRDLNAEDTTNVYTMEEIEQAYADASEDTKKFKGVKYTIVGVVKEKWSTTEVSLEVSGYGPVKTAVLSFFFSEEDNLLKYDRGSKISAYCAGHGLDEGIFGTVGCQIRE